MRSLTQDDDSPDTIENDFQYLEAKYPDSDEEFLDVHYEENKFKETLDMFNDQQPNVTNKHNPGKLVVAHNLLATSEVIKAHTAKILNEVENDSIKSYVVIETPYESSHSFGEAKKLIDNKVNTSNYSEEEILSDKRDFSLEYSTDLNEDEVSRTESSLETDPEIIDLKEKRLVKDLLGKFSKSYPSISVTSVKQVEQHADITEDVECSEDKVVENTQEQEIDVIPSVKNLKQLFDKENSNSPTKRDSKQIYSLTARSLSIQFRQKLKSDDEASIPSEETTTTEKVADEEIEEILPLDITKNRIAFFEHLGNK
ncbi:hypothetical protein AMK59_4770 [Oryctes borbonicus]|uniref:Uncharacterized protein n=1 Tax=Oryctes borbonicus TaxID=1629725 RepID=A0A0T6B5X7_9SCAR|nr:hypothetical protein AMK59_4770 [Oryctes borbonicus]